MKAHELVSAHHIQVNLVQAAAAWMSQRTTTTSGSSRSSNATTTTASYWDMPSAPPQKHEIPAALYRHLYHSEATTTQSQPQSYWDWSAGNDLHHVQSRTCVDDDTFEQNLLHEATPSNCIAGTANADAEHDNTTDGYWIF